ncbi:MAG: isoleucyl-tRNA synthetase [Parcubacteria group bacterium Gr01-1014_66]|nr:MAG: isoleucyl-tRNA synthetase [Parcubacteria group bacterium Gr01-1014_66]
MREEQKKKTLPELEEEILHFWEEHRIFEQSLEKNKRKPVFVFYEGPPTANGAPGIHHLGARAFKDLIPRYKTMRGFFVPRRAGWDTHGLPVEIQVEKELGLKSKKDIEEFGIAAFNAKAKESVWRYEEQWERFTKRIGFWIDLKDPYITSDVSYIEALWRIMKEFWDHGLLEEDFKIVPWCPRCQTSLSTHELAQGYRMVEDVSVYIRFPIISNKGRWQYTSLLSWTTTPWTLPGNVALAINPEELYVRVPDPQEHGHSLIVAFNLLSKLVERGVLKEEATRLRAVQQGAFPGHEIVGVKYEPLFHLDALASHTSYQVYAADFVRNDEGTGIVHTAVMYGEDDYMLGKKVGLPAVHTVDESGRFITELGEELAGRYVRDADTESRILSLLKKRKALVKEEKWEHEYPFCWRCATPLLYFAKNAWWVRVREKKEELLARNQKINWIPAHLKEGRFGEFLREVRDWAFSRERYWGTPLPIWRCNKCGEIEVCGSRMSLAEKMGTSRNRYILMRHGEAVSNKENVIVSRDDAAYPLTARGKRQVEDASRILAEKNIDTILASPLLRTQETAHLIAEKLGKKDVVRDERLSEINVGIFEKRDTASYHAFFSSYEEKFTKIPPGGESLSEVRNRVFAFLEECEGRFEEKTILVVGHEYPLWMMESVMRGLTDKEAILMRKKGKKDEMIGYAEIRETPYLRLPRDPYGAVDLHRPFVDACVFPCKKCEGEMKRVSDVADVWFDSGAMPFAANAASRFRQAGDKERFPFPADYICEGVDQTRGWFYTLLVVATLMRKPAPYRTVISLGHILDKNGQKMSKSKGNVVDPWEMIGKYGADALRWYMYTINAPGEAKRFDETDVVQRLRGFLQTWWNCFVFFDTYVEKISGKPSFERKERGMNVLDKWVVIRLQEVTALISDRLDHYDVTAAARTLEEFVIDDFSQWYVRRSRSRLQHPQSQKDYAEVSRMCGISLWRIALLGAPFVPFLSDAIYQRLRKKTPLAYESVHLEPWPKATSLHARDKRELELMALARRACSQGLKMRTDAGIKVRQPLESLTLQEKEYKALSKNFLSLICDEVNVKRIQWGNTMLLDLHITPVLKEEGMVRDFVRHVQEMRRDAGMKPKEKIQIQIAGDMVFARLLERWKKRVLQLTAATHLMVGGKKQFRIERELTHGHAHLWVGIR